MSWFPVVQRNLRYYIIQPGNEESSRTFIFLWKETDKKEQNLKGEEEKLSCTNTLSTNLGSHSLQRVFAVLLDI